MDIEDPVLNERLRKIIRRFSPDVHSVEDLLQEARLHLWREGLAGPERTPSWCIQRCCFRVLAVLRRGRSLDSPKRRAMRCDFPDASDGEDGEIDSPWVDDPVLSEVCERDLLAQLRQRLGKTPEAVLNHLAQGRSFSEAANLLGISQQAASKARKKLINETRKLGFEK